ncbi:MAG: molecular chaperone HtpG [Ruminococcaceae bacterium]|nr:molecular chaperone HtpG [Oscillospiraceae bacterium]
MDSTKGSVSINAENIFPIIKKWLYSEKDIFIREIVSNASDAISKMKKLTAVGEATIPEGTDDWKIEVILDKENGTITVHDNGIGMTEEEVKKYINQVAFSGAVDFLEKYEGKTDDAQIIGHFGLGFYSSFMVSKKVEIDTLSWAPGSKAVHWESESGMEFEMSASDLDERGTYITMHIAEDSVEYLDSFKLRDTLEKYFAFLPVNLFFIDIADEKEEEKKDEVIDVDEEGNTESTEEKKDDAPKALNDTSPLWLKPAKDCTEEEYKEFYHKVFNDYNDPLFWIHLNVDYPFNLKGILYFPKLKNNYDTLEGTIKVYYNQVFVADNVKEILPEFLMLLKGVIDCPDLPLNVSRSFLQNDGYVNKISSHITKKVADKLNGLFKTEREQYCTYWDDINPFVKYGCLKEDKFYDKVKDSLIYKTTKGEYFTCDEYLEKYQPDAENKTISYSDDTTLQAQYIKILEATGIDPVILDGPIDSHFIQLAEYKNAGKFKFTRVDADVSDKIKDESSKESKEAMTALAESVTATFRAVAESENLKVSVEPIKTKMPAMIILSEQARRMQELAKMYGMTDMAKMGLGADDITLVLNYSNPIVKQLATLKETDEEKLKVVCGQIYDLAMLAHKPLDTEVLTRFIERSGDILAKFAED